MTETMKPPYGTEISQPDETAGVEVGGGDKAAAAHDRKARDAGRPGGSDGSNEEPNPQDPDEAQSPT